MTESSPIKTALTPRILGSFLFGKREAIVAVASSRAAIVLALLFIISAGLARNYDHHLLAEELLWIGGPVGMSLFSSTLIFFFISLFGKIPAPQIRYSNYLAFLHCFLMTAPMAWLYGIPVEQFSGILASSIFNFSILLVVSVWRVALMIRVLVVLFNFTALRAFALIAIPASAEMFFGTLMKSMDIVGIMGGIRLDEGEKFLLQATQTMTIGSVVLFVIAIIVAFISKRGDLKEHIEKSPGVPVAASSWILAVGAIVAWSLFALPHQKKLRTKADFSQLIRKREYKQASLFLVDKTQSDFPKHHSLVRQPSMFSAPTVHVTLLAQKTSFPEWFREQLKNDVRLWIHDHEILNYEPGELEKDLYKAAAEMPYVQEVADELTPGIKVSELWEENEKKTTDALQTE